MLFDKARRTNFCVDDLELSWTRLGLVSGADQGDEGRAEEHLYDSPCAVVWECRFRPLTGVLVQMELTHGINPAKRIAISDAIALPCADGDAAGRGSQ